MPGGWRRVGLCGRHANAPCRHGATGGCSSPFHPLLHAEGSQGWSSSRRHATLRGRELSTKEKLPAGSVAPAVWEEAPSKRTAPGSARHRAELLPQLDARSIPPVRSLGSGVEFKLRSSSLCKTPRRSSRPARGPGGESGRRGPRTRRNARKSKRGKATASAVVPGRGKSSQKSSLASPRDNLGLDSLSVLLTP